MSQAPVGEETVDLDSSPFERPPVEGLPFARDSEEARAIQQVIKEYAAARATAGPGEFASTPDSPFRIPPTD